MSVCIARFNLRCCIHYHIVSFFYQESQHKLFVNIFVNLSSCHQSWLSDQATKPIPTLGRFFILYGEILENSQFRLLGYEIMLRYIIYPDTTHFASGCSLVCCLCEHFITKCDRIWHSSIWAWRCQGYSSFDISGFTHAWGYVVLSLPSALSYIGIN